MKLDLFDAMKNAQERFLASSGSVHIVSHLDCDGICSAAIMIRVLQALNREFSLEFLPQLSLEKIKGLQDRSEKTIIFTDLGSAHAGAIDDNLTGQVFILDHHRPDATELKKNIIHVNPHMFGIDGGREISGSGVVYLFSKSITSCMADLAVVGAIGDSQEKGGFRGVNKDILDEAVQNDLVKVNKDLRFFGIYSKPLHRLLTLSYDTYIPGITGDEQAAVRLIEKLGLSIKKGNRWLTYPDLDDEQKKMFVDEIIRRRKGLSSPDDIYCNVYTSAKGVGSFFDLRETSTILNACGRLGKARLGCDALLGDEKKKEKAEEILSTYRTEITCAIAWYNENKNSFARSKNLLIINAKDNVRSTMVGTLASILTRSRFVPEGTIVIILGRDGHGMVKVSARVFGNKKIDLRNILADASKKVKGESGGHRNAAGAVFEKKHEEKFIDEVEQAVSKRCS